MRLESLHHMMRINARVFVIKTHNEAEGDDVVLAAVDPSAAVLFASERPSHGIDDLAGSYASGRQLPELLHTHAVGLRIAILIEVEAADELLGKGSAWTFAQDCDLGVEIIAGLKVCFRLIEFVHTLVIGA